MVESYQITDLQLPSRRPLVNSGLRSRLRAWAWVFTLPVCGLIGFLTELLCNLAGYH